MNVMGVQIQRTPAKKKKRRSLKPVQREFANYQATEREQLKRNFKRRAVGAAGTGLLAALAFRKGGPFLANRAKVFATGQEAAFKSAVGEMGPSAAKVGAKGHLDSQHWMLAKGARWVRDKLGMKTPFGLGEEALKKDWQNIGQNAAAAAQAKATATAARWGAGRLDGAANHYIKAGVGTGSAFLGLGSVRDYRATRRREGARALRMLTQ